MTGPTAQTSEDQEAHTRAKGRQGENTAVDHLLNNGYTVVCRNYQTKAGEIDIVARDPNGVTVFVEVKSGCGASFGHPFFRINRKKQAQLIRMAQWYRMEHAATNQPCRFDIIAVRGEKVEHLKNAFLAG